MINSTKVAGFDATRWNAAFTAVNAAQVGRPGKVNWVMTELILVIMVIYVTMVYGPIAAFLVEMFPTKIRYTSMSLPYHIGNGWFGGMLPLTATALVAVYGDIYSGLWYPIMVAVTTFVVGRCCCAETKDRDISASSAVAKMSGAELNPSGPVTAAIRSNSRPRANPARGFS